MLKIHTKLVDKMTKLVSLKPPTVLINWRCRCGCKGRLEAIYFTSFDFDYHESKLAHVLHKLDKFAFN